MTNQMQIKTGLTTQAVVINSAPTTIWLYVMFADSSAIGMTSNLQNHQTVSTLLLAMMSLYCQGCARPYMLLQ